MTTQDPQELLPVLGKKYSATLLVETAEPRTAQELSDKLDIPIATCYRRIDDLCDCGLLEQSETKISSENRQVKAYKRSIDDFSVDFDGSASVTFETESGIGNIDRIWQKLRSVSRTLQ